MRVRGVGKGLEEGTAGCGDGGSGPGCADEAPGLRCGGGGGMRLLLRHSPFPAEPGLAPL